MALSTYGVKYRLDYSSNDLDIKWRLDILKDGYASSIINLTGQSSPITIEWLGDDDSVHGVIGSVANINLFQEEGQDLSEFYTANLQEFLVQIYYQRGDEYELYWKGFIIQDEYIEEVMTEPFTVNLKAADGLGLISDYKTSEVLDLNEQPTPFEFIKACIDLIGLEFDFYDCCEFSEESVGNYTTSSAFTQVRFNSESFLQNQTNVNSWIDLNQSLDSVMKAFNCRLIQSNGALYAQNPSTSASTHTEYKAMFYDYSADAWSSQDVDKRVFDVPYDLQPMQSDLIRRQSPAYKFYTRTYKIAPRNLFYNANFELGTQGITANSNFSITSSQSENGDRAAEFAAEPAVSDATFNAASEATKTSTSGYTILEFSTNVTSYQTIEWNNTSTTLEMFISFYVYVNEVPAASTDTWDIRYSLEFDGVFYGFDGSPASASFTNGTRTIEAVDFRKWVKIEFPVLFITTLSASYSPVVLRIHSPGQSGSVDLLFDNFVMHVQPAEFIQSEYNINATKLITNSRQLDGTNTTGRLEDELFVGASSFGSYSAAGTNPTVTLEQGVSGVVYGQFYKASTITTRPELVKFDWRSDPRISPDSRALDLWNMIQNAELYQDPNRRYEGTFRNVKAPLKLYDVADDVSSNWTESTTGSGTSFDFNNFTWTFSAGHTASAINRQTSGNILSLTAGQKIKLVVESGTITNDTGNSITVNVLRDGGGFSEGVQFFSGEDNTTKEIFIEVPSTANYYIEATAASIDTNADTFEIVRLEVLNDVNPYSMFDLFNIDFNTLTESNNHIPVKLSFDTKSNRYNVYGFELQPVPNVLTDDFTDVGFDV